MGLFDVTRRNLIRKLGMTGAAGVAGTMTAGMGSVRGTRGNGNVTKTLDFTKPEDNLIGAIKMHASLEAKDVPHWYYGTIYGLNDGIPPKPLIDLEGSEISYFHRNEDGSYRGFSNTISIFRDVETGEVLKTWFNPYTEKTVEVEANYLPVTGLYYHYSVNGIRVSGTQDMIPDEPLILKWNELGDHTMMSGERKYPPGIIRGEAQAGHGPTVELHDPDLPEVINAFGAPTYMAAWPSWMGMKDYPGRVIWSVVARKTKTVEEYPKEFLDILERDYPEKLSAVPKQEWLETPI